MWNRFTSSLSRTFSEEIFPYLQPVPVSKDKIVSFLRDNRLYLAIRLYPKENRNPANRQPFYFVMKQPYAKVPRFIELPPRGNNYYIMFTEDIIKANLNLIFLATTSIRATASKYPVTPTF